MTSLQDHMKEAIMRAMLASPLRCPKELRKHVKYVLRRKAGSSGHRRAMDGYRQAFNAYVFLNPDNLPEILKTFEDSNVE